MAYIQRNLNPCIRTVGDCAVRALAAATYSTWEDTYDDLCTTGFQMCDMPSSNEVISAYMRKRGFKKHLIDIPRYTIAEFADDHPKGVYVLGTGTHVVAVIDGNYIDVWDSGCETPVYYYEKGDAR